MPSIHVAGFYVFRRPLVPVDSIFRLFEQTGTRSDLEAQLQAFFREPHLGEAIYLASPQLHARMEQWLRGGVVPDKQRLFKSLFKYLVRAGTRCTPYGMFAGCVQIGHFARHTQIVFAEENSYVRYARPDMGCLVHLAEGIGRHPEVRRQLKFYPNSSLYGVGDQYRYTFYEIEQHGWNYSVCSVDKSEYLEQVFAAAREGATRRQIAGSLTSDEVTLEEAEEYVDQLITEQLLVSDLQLNLTGPHYFETLLGVLSAMQEIDEVVGHLRTIRRLLQTADNSIAHYRQVQEIVHQHFSQGAPADVVQTDIWFRTEVNQIGQTVIDTLTGNLEKLMVLHQGHYNADLDDFRKKFYERYEEEEVPLLAVLDPEIGIGYGARGEQQAGHLPLIESLDVQPQKKGAAIEWNFWKDFVLRKYSEALFGQQHQILLTDEDIALLESRQDPRACQFRTTFTAFGNLLAGSAAAADQGDFLFNLYAIAGPSAANLLGRFCPLDPKLRRHVEACLRQEEQQFPEAVFAEIVHLPEARAGNILARPAFRQYEIPYLAKASVDADCQIPLTDIMVSLKNGREIVLRSRRLNIPIIPRLATAHNYKKGLSIYKFLCDVQYQDQAPNVFWHWSMLEKQGFLPRVRYRNVIVSRATWNLSLQEYPELHNPQLPVSAFFAHLQTKLRLPRYVSLAESDNELLIDFQNIHCLELLRATFLKKELITLKEYLQSPDQCLLESGAGKYTNEIIIPLYQDKSGARQAASPTVPYKAGTTQRTFSLGSEWVYFKIYTGEKTADALLQGPLKTLSEELGAEGLVDQWFFIRYADPNPHLRVRFHGNPEKEFYRVVLQKLHLLLNGFLENGLVYKLQTDTYKRELERYGNSTMALSEEIFFHDSEATLRLLCLLGGDTNEKYRWLFAMYAIDTLLDDFDVSLTAKQELLERLQQNYFTEFGAGKSLKHQLNDNYRRDLKEILPFLDAYGSTEEKKLFAAILEDRSARNREAVKRHAPGAARLTLLLPNYIHMSLNRLFMAEQRTHELVIYSYLSKYYTSLLRKRTTSQDFMNT